MLTALAVSAGLLVPNAKALSNALLYVADEGVLFSVEVVEHGE